MHTGGPTTNLKNNPTADVKEREQLQNVEQRLVHTTAKTLLEEIVVGSQVPKNTRLCEMHPNVCTQGATIWSSH